MWQTYPSEVQNFEKDVQGTSKSELSPYLANFFTMGLLSGYDVGHAKCLKGKYRIILRTLQFMVIVVVILILAVPSSSDTQMYGMMLNGFEYVLFVTCLSFTKYNIYDLTREINSIDKAIIRSSEKMIAIIGFIVILGLFVLKSVICVIICYVYEGMSIKCPGNLAPGYVTCSTALVIDGVSVMEIFVNYYIYRAVKYLKIMLKEHADLNVIKKYYVKIADCYDKIMPLYGVFVIGELLTSVPKSMIMLVNLIVTIKSNSGLIAAAAHLVFIVHIGFQFFGPAASVQKINYEVKALKLELNNQLMREKDIEKKQDLFGLVQYMEARKLEYRLLRVVPIDLRLVVIFTNITTTYFIVILQFTHLL